MPVADGATYEQVVARGCNTLEDYIALAREDGIPLPAPATYVS